MSLVVRVAAPIGRDAELIVAVLKQNGVEAEACSDLLAVLASACDEPLGPLLITEEALTPVVIEHIADVVARQPTWSDFPILVLTHAGRETMRSRDLEAKRQALGTPILLERPIRTETLLSSVRVALRARSRQYQVRDALQERDRVLADLHTERERLKVVVESVPIGIYLADGSGKVVLSNPAVERIIQQTMPEQIPSPDWRLLYSDGTRVPTSELPLLRALTTGHPVSPKEYLYERGDGIRSPVSVAAAPISNDKGHVVAAVVALVDLSTQKQAESALIQSEKLAAVGRLAASISHEINNPLEAVTNLLYLIGQDPNLPSQARCYLGLADRELARVSQIASQTLRFHRQSTRPREVTPEELIESVVGIYQGRLHNSSIKVIRQHRPAAAVTCYEGDIRQVLNNLVGNAIDSMRTGGRLVLRTHNSSLWRDEGPVPGIRITVADTGHGMSTEVRSRIFEAFYTTKGNNGTGLGLWISHGIIEKHHGRLDVWSSNRPPHTGTVFSLFLPRDLLPEDGPTLKTPAVRHPTSGSKPTS